MSSVKIVLVVGVVLTGVGAVPVYCQEAKLPADIRMLLNQSPTPSGVDPLAVPDIRDLAKPKTDGPPVEPPIKIIVADPHCRPGEDGLEGYNSLRRTRRSR